MMRLPARLIAKLTKARFAQFRNSSLSSSFLQWIDAAEILHPGSSAPVSHQKMQTILQTRAPVIWIGGSEPLVHPGVGHFVRVIAQSGHYVFLETNGTLLRRRIHEFQPLPQVFLVVRLGSRRNSEFDLAVEGLRAARLSGFFTAVRTVVDESVDDTKLTQLRTLLEEMGIDGWLITAESADARELGKAAEARALVPRTAWRWLSRQIERELLAQRTEREERRPSEKQAPNEEACEEGVKAV